MESEISDKYSSFLTDIKTYEDAISFRKDKSNILLGVVTNQIPLTPLDKKDSNKHLTNCLILSWFFDHPDVEQYALKYLNVNSMAPFEIYKRKEPVVIEKSAKKAKLSIVIQSSADDNPYSDVHVVQCCYKFLMRFPEKVTFLWDWPRLINTYCNHSNRKILWMIKDCVSFIANMSEVETKKLTLHFPIESLDEAIFSMINKKPIMPNPNPDYCEEVFDTTVKVGSILLPLCNPEHVQPGILVPVKSTMENLRSLALAVASGKAICLMGPVGSGKTSLVEHLAAITGRNENMFKKLQLGDQTDSRMLLGTHQCTDLPGEFVWRPGLLTQAVQHGHWLLLEDIDCATLDVASTLSSLLERKALTVPGYRDSLPIAPGFQLFVTQRTVATNFGFQKKLSVASTLLQKQLIQINVEPLSKSELKEVIHTFYPGLVTISSRIVDLFMYFSDGNHESSLHHTEDVNSQKIPTHVPSNISLLKGTRPISTRDLRKWCTRAVLEYRDTTKSSALKVLQDALDLFIWSAPCPKNRLELGKVVGTHLGVIEPQVKFFFNNYKPAVSLSPGSFVVGRASLERKSNFNEVLEKKINFSFTKQSSCLLEKMTCCVSFHEPVLLVGETGTGKTSTVQYLARETGHKLVVINMNQQSDTADLLGGYKPVDMMHTLEPITKAYLELFKGFFNVEKNKKFLKHIEDCAKENNWPVVCVLIQQSYQAAIRRLADSGDYALLQEWLAFGDKLLRFEEQLQSNAKFSFSFCHGSLVRAMQDGHWVLLDEINLASAEILECLAGLLEDKMKNVQLAENGDDTPIKVHPDFTIFACMNPATDVGKKDLPVGLRNRFTEFFVDDLTDGNDLIILIGDYLKHMSLDAQKLTAIRDFYIKIKQESRNSLTDGAGNPPLFSLRTLCRALAAATKARCGTVIRSLYEAFCLSFLTQLDRTSHMKVEAMITKAIIGRSNIRSILNQKIPEPRVPGISHVEFEGHWIATGKLEPIVPSDYILTPTIRKNLRDIARIISIAKLPVLLQGDTSVGKTSLITYIAKASGNFCVRINNHEHTDLQEYIGGYSTDANGKLVFIEGILPEAMKKGHWIILDELNLAPSDVLEALNRVLDDNRELYIPETQQTIRADPNFMLFATQNPPGLYGGRKMLSRAFRNRFVELHFDLIPRNELITILNQRCHIPISYCKKMISVMQSLQILRRGSAAAQGKDGFITLRDLFRWGQRYKLATKEHLTANKFYDWDQHIADEGFLILAGKVREPTERTTIIEVIKKCFNRQVNPENLFSLHEHTSPVTKTILQKVLNNKLKDYSHVVWTFNMRRLAVLIAKSFEFQQPVLLVGETGCGKTTICQVMAALKNTDLLIVNCHMHTESTDFLGGLRPVRHGKNDGKLFEWVDGPLIKAMEKGYLFLADEISLADDSVLERLNSLLEPERQLVLAERGYKPEKDIVMITAHPEFHFIATMNPGGDFGKKELSPALRNRLTEIWCDNVTSRNDLLNVLERSVNADIHLGNQKIGNSGIGDCILDFSDWLKSSNITNKFPFSIRDLLSWVHFINNTVSKNILNTYEAYVHGASMIFLDCFGTALTGHIEQDALCALREEAIDFLLKQISYFNQDNIATLEQTIRAKESDLVAESDVTKFGIKPFYINAGGHKNDKIKYSFDAPTTGANTLRLLRGMQLKKPILLEGNPGVGKTSMVTALAKVSGHKVVRINLSDQTDIADLFGSDFPTEDGSFVFKEGEFLRALRNGDWILLDELNLAPQPVLEGLNACLDHRGEVYVPELGQTFKVKNDTHLFACQNPLKQGGARRGLPVSFLNRFTQVYIDTLTQKDLIFIVEAHYPTIPKEILHKIVQFNCKVAHETNILQKWGHKGAPWEMNLRDIQRWCDALVIDQESDMRLFPGKFVDFLYINRMRSNDDKQIMAKLYDDIFLPKYPRSAWPIKFHATDKILRFGDVVIKRNNNYVFKSKKAIQEGKLFLLRSQLPAMKALAQNVKMNWLSIIVGSTGTGKSSIVQALADLTGNELHVVPVTSAMDVTDLLGGYEQIDHKRNLDILHDKIELCTIQTMKYLWLNEEDTTTVSKLLSEINRSKSMNTDNNSGCLEKINVLFNIYKQIREINNPQHINDLNEIQASLTRSKDIFSKIDVKCVGGKFQWNDSILVKAMMEGSWILLDNVNLTSSAVLDRLNGLLETNGTLSIPERGENIEMKPHSNFRVFFTMDPKYGEISRAMRNRGVEICLLRHDEIDEPINRMDLYAMLQSCGLVSEYHQIFEDGHKLMSSYIYGLEKPTTSHMLQAAYLTTQQLLRGVPYTTAIETSFTDVYIKSRTGADFDSNSAHGLADMKRLMLIALRELIQGYELRKGICPYHTLPIAGLSKHASISITRQLAYPILQCYPQKDEQFLFDILKAFKKCSSDHLCTLAHLLRRELQRNSDSLAFHVREAVKDIVPILSNFHGEVYDDLLNDVPDEKISLSNSTYLTLYNLMINAYDKLMLPNTEELTAIKYSSDISSGTMNDMWPEYPLLKNLGKHLVVIDKIIRRVFKSRDYNRSNEFTCQMIKCFNWKRRFCKVAATLPVVVDTKINESTLSMLYIHNHWLDKKFIGILTEFLKPASILYKNYKTCLLDMVPPKDYDSGYFMYSKKLKKYFGQPYLNKDEDCYKLAVQRSKLYSNICVDLNQPAAKIESFFIRAGATADYKMVLDVPDSETLANASHSFTALSINNIQNVNRKRESMLLPLMDYIFVRVLNLLKNDFMYMLPKLQNSSRSDLVFMNKTGFEWDFTNILGKLIEFGKGRIGFPPELISLMELLLKLNEPASMELRDCASTFTVTFWNAFYKKMLNSPAKLPDLFFNDEESDEADDECKVKSTLTITSNAPLLLYCVQKSTIADVNNEGPFPPMIHETISLQDHTNYKKQLSSYHNALWNNMALMSTSLELKIKSDAIFECNRYEQLITFLYLITTKETLEVVAYRDDWIEKLVENLNSCSNEIQPIMSLIKKARDIYKELSDILNLHNEVMKNTDKVKIFTNVLSLWCSVILIIFMGDMSIIDRAQKQQLKLVYNNEDVKMFHMILSSYYMQGVISGKIDTTEDCLSSLDVKPTFYEEGKRNREMLKNMHPFCEIFMRMLKEAEDSIYKYSHGNMYRPSSVSYKNFVLDCKHFIRSFLTSRMVKNFTGSKLTDTLGILLKIIKKNKFDIYCRNKAATYVRDTSTWLVSLRSFIAKMENEYLEAFPDLAKPFLFSISQLIYSLTNVNEVITEFKVKIEKGPDFIRYVTDLLIYPNILPPEVEKQKGGYYKRFLNPKLMAMLNKSVDKSIVNKQYIVAARMVVLLKMNLYELAMQCFTKGEIDKFSMEGIITTISVLLRTWTEQQKEIAKKKEMDDALYVTKSKCEEVDEETQTKMEISEMFPQFADEDFGEFKASSLEQHKIPNKQVENDRGHLLLIMKPEDVSTICKLHSRIVCDLTTSEWLALPIELPSPDYATPLMLKYQLFSALMKNSWNACASDFEGKLSPTMLTLLSMFREKLEGNVQPKKVDFYKSPWVSEAKQCLPLLLSIKDATQALLDQWPDFPSLKDIMLIVNRILTFPITSPVARFLTGLELVRDKIEEWNKQAHSGNNMIDISLRVAERIINWRKLEMSHWKNMLNNIFERKQAEAHVYWFHLYGSVQCFLEGEGSEAEFIAVLKDFMTNSNLSEFQIRLDILRTFHCHLIHLEKSEKRNVLLSILWNVYLYFNQFSEQVAKYINENRAPIEKKLRDFVKICRWDRDISYWSVKDTIEKAHKVLHKHTKDFEKLLEQPVAPLFAIHCTIKDVNEPDILDRSQPAKSLYMYNESCYYTESNDVIKIKKDIARMSTNMGNVKQTTLANYLKEDCLLRKVLPKANKTSALCKEILDHTNYPSLLQSLDDFVTQVIETSIHLATLEVDTNVIKKKQLSQASQILQQKRKALADLFRYLTRIGLNYRTGLVILNSSEDLYDFTLPPVDVHAAISYLENRRSCDLYLSQLWFGCEMYFQRNIVRHKILEHALRTPHQDLGLQTIERCKGFSALLLKKTNDQKRSIALCSRQLCDLRNITANFTEALKIDNTTVLSSLKERISVLYDCHCDVVLNLEQIIVLIKSCPEIDTSNPSEFEPMFDQVLSDSPIVKCYKNSDEWNYLYNKIEATLKNAKKKKNTLQKLNYPMTNGLGKNCVVSRFTKSHIIAANEAQANLEKILLELRSLLEHYKFTFKASVVTNYEIKHPILNCIASVCDYVASSYDKVQKLRHLRPEPMDEDDSDTINDFSKKSEYFVLKMLLIVEDMYKTHLTRTSEESQDKEELKELLEVNHFKILLEDRLAEDLKCLQLSKIIAQSSDLYNLFIHHLLANREVNILKDIGMRVLPFMEQVVMFVQYYITQQVAVHRISCKMLSVLLKIFSDLSTKGFCKPAELQMEDGDGEGGQFSGSGTGLGDGDGQKDVSDRIENQDQLDDATRPGEDKKDENKDCKEEKNGVNMTDDFDSHLQDVEEKEDQSNKDDEDDADKQMGDTENTADKLDQQIWGEDEEELEEESNANEKEEKGSGESTGEKEMTAKDEEQGMDDGDKGKDKKQKKDINEMKEQEIDDDHVDPYHGNHPELPEPQDYEIPDNMNGIDEDDKDGETETEKPFEIDVMQDAPEDGEDEKQEKEKNNEGLNVSSDEYDDEDGNDQNIDEEIEKESEEPENLDNGENPDDMETDEQDDGKSTAEDDSQKDQEALENQEAVENTQNADKTNEDKEKEQRKDRNTQKPSNNDQSQKEAENAEMDTGTDDNVQTNPEQNKDEDAEDFEQSQEQVGDERQRTGRSELDQSDKGHQGQKQKASQANGPRNEKQKNYENKPGKTEQERTLGEVLNKSHKKSRTLNVEKDDKATEESGQDNTNKDQEADAYQHVKQARNDDIQMVDAATKDQADKQPTIEIEDSGDEMCEDDNVVVISDDDMEVEEIDNQIQPETSKAASTKEKTRNDKNGGDENTGDTGVEIIGETILTHTVSRGNKNTYHTRLDIATRSGAIREMGTQEYITLRSRMTNGPRLELPSNATAIIWRDLWSKVGGQARDLSERLRLVLEPTTRSRLAGDYRTGRRINMRRIIPYIASQFSKDRIWLRRTKPAKRDYKIAIAIDDSSSMCDNQSKELAYESLALVSQALNLLESGDLAVLSFGNDPVVLHPFSEQFSEQSGAKIVENLKFEQNKTKVKKLLDFATVMFNQQPVPSDALNAKLLIIVSDARGVNSEGDENVAISVRNARQHGIFVVFVILDNPKNKSSVLDIKRVVTDMSGGPPQISLYLDTFPFPFYVVVRDLTTLPYVLGDALRQWFELAANGQ